MSKARVKLITLRLLATDEAGKELMRDISKGYLEW
jgi:hypothetical protein